MLSHFAASLAGALSHLLATLVAHAPSVAHAAPFLFATAPAVLIDGEADPGDDGDAEEGESIADVSRDILEDIPEDERQRQLSTGTSAEDDEPAGDVVDDEEIDLEGRADLEDVKPKAGAKGKDAKAKEAAGDDDDAPTMVKVILPGQTARGEEDLEIELDANDTEVLDRIRRLKNDGLRAREYTDRREALEEREARMEAYADELEVDPISFHLNRMKPEQQLEVARALIVEHLDALAPDIDKFLEDPRARGDARIKMRDDMKASGERLTQARDVKAMAQRCIRAVEKLIPEGTDDDLVTDFTADARSILAAAASKGERVNPQTVPALLARKIKLYGFDKKAAKPQPKALAKPAANEPPKARPLSDKAREIAGRKGPVTEALDKQQSRIRRTQAARRAGSRIAPAGAGTGSSRAPDVPAEAEQDVASMSRHLRGQQLPETWQGSDG